MELKHITGKEDGYRKPNLIEPKWNWNLVYIRSVVGFKTEFNWTKVELKHNNTAFASVTNDQFNWTKVELKQNLKEDGKSYNFAI